MKRAAVVGLAFVVGAAFGYWLAPEADAPARVPHPGVTVPPGPAQRVARDQEETPAPPPPAGHGTIRGRVLDEHAAPIAHALVVAVPDRPGSGARQRRAGEVPWEESGLRRSVAALRWYERHHRRTRTDAEGRYEITGLGAVPHAVRAYREGYRIRRAADAPRGDVTPDATVDFTGKRLVLVHVDVVMPAGETVDNVWLRRKGPASSGSGNWSAASPWIELPPGTYELQAVAGQRQEYTSEKRTIRVESDVEPEPVRLLLSGKRGIRVRVKLPEGFTARQLSLRYLRFEGTDPPRLDLLRTSGGDASAGDSGEAWIPGLEPGRYLVGVHHGHYHFTAGAVADVGEGITELVLEVPIPDPAECFTVRAFRPDGRIERHASVNPSIQTSERGTSGGGTIMYGPDGTMYCAYPRWDAGRSGELPEDARYLAKVGANDLGRKTIEFAPEPGAALEVHFAEPSTLRVAIADYAESEHKDTLLVTLHQEGTGPVTWWQPLTPEGTQEFAPLQPGAYRIVINKSAGGFDRWPIMRRDVELKSGDNDVTIPIPRLYPLEVEIAQPKTGATVTLAGSVPGERFSIRRGVPTDGIVRFTDIPAGKFDLYYNDQRLPVTVPHQGRFQIR